MQLSRKNGRGIVPVNLVILEKQKPQSMNPKPDPADVKISSISKAKIEYKSVSSILTPASGFMDLYDFTLNPYSGCSFGCTYCYAAFFSRTAGQRDTWGKWVQVKQNALNELIKWRKKPLIDKTIYISSVTDPYQPLEKDLRLTRHLLQELSDFHQVRPVIQTRSPLVKRDIELFHRFRYIQVNMTITTDSEVIRKMFEPRCPPNEDRLKAIKEVSDAGIPACITMTPLLPIENIDAFIQGLRSTGISKLTVQPFHLERGKFIAGTRQAALELLRVYDWSPQKYLEVESQLRKAFPAIGIGKNGFKPI
jgi:DNA repair photolyase